MQKFCCIKKGKKYTFNICLKKKTSSLPQIHQKSKGFRCMLVMKTYSTVQITSLLDQLVQLLIISFTSTTQRLDGIYTLFAVSRIVAVDTDASLPTICSAIYDACGQVDLFTLICQNELSSNSALSVIWGALNFYCGSFYHLQNNLDCTFYLLCTAGSYHVINVGVIFCVYYRLM